MQSLKTVQTIFKVLKVFTLIVFIFKIIGAACALIGGIGLVAFKSFGSFSAQISVAIADKLYGGIVSVEAGMYEATVVCFVVAMLCACGAVCTHFLYRYFQHEEQDGTPFSYRGADELKRVGIIYIAVQLGAELVAVIIFAVCGVENAELSNFAMVGEGIVMILLSFVFKHGAELGAAFGSQGADRHPRIPPSDDRFI